MPSTLADFPPDRFAIHAYCARGHQARVPPETLPRDLLIDALRARLRCQACGGREVSIRIVWAAAGGFKHSGGVAASSAVAPVSRR